MKDKKKRPSKRGLYAAITGTGVVVLCCFTPILVVTIGLVGLSALTPYLDYVLYPALAVMIVVTLLAYKKYKKGCRGCDVCGTGDELEIASTDIDKNK